MAVYVCNQCKKENKEFKVPADEIGMALMQEHLKDHRPQGAQPHARSR